MEFTWKDILPLLHGVDSADVFDALSHAILSSVKTTDLPDIFHSIACEYAKQEDLQTRMIAAAMTEMLTEKFRRVLHPLLLESSSDGALLSIDQLDTTALFSGKYVLGKGSIPITPCSNKDMYTKTWYNKQKQRFQRILGSATGSLDASIAIMQSVDEIEYLADSNITPAMQQNVLYHNDTMPQLLELQQQFSGIYERTSETWFARIVRHFIVNLSDECWIYRDGASRCLFSILKGLTIINHPSADCRSIENFALPHFLVHDCMCVGIIVLVLDRWIEFKDLVSSDAPFQGDDRNQLSVMPVKSSIAILIAQCFRSLNDHELVFHFEKVLTFIDKLISSHEWTMQYGGIVLIIELSRAFPEQFFSECCVHFTSLSDALNIATLNDVDEVFSLSLEIIEIMKKQILQNHLLSSTNMMVLDCIGGIVSNLAAKQILDIDLQNSALLFSSHAVELLLMITPMSNEEYRSSYENSIVLAVSMIRNLVSKMDRLILSNVRPCTAVLEALSRVGSRLSKSSSVAIIENIVGLLIVMLQKLDRISEAPLVEKTIDENAANETPSNKKTSIVLNENFRQCVAVVSEWVEVESILRSAFLWFAQILKNMLGTEDCCILSQNLMRAFISILMENDREGIGLHLQGVVKVEWLQQESPSSQISVAFSGLFIQYFIQAFYILFPPSGFSLFPKALEIILQIVNSKVSSGLSSAIQYDVSEEKLKKGKRKVIISYIETDSNQSSCWSENAVCLAHWLIDSPIDNNESSGKTAFELLSSLKELSSLKAESKRRTRKASQQVDFWWSLQSMDVADSVNFLLCEKNHFLEYSWNSVRSCMFVVCNQFIGNFSPIHANYYVDRIVQYLFGIFTLLIKEKQLQFRSMVIQSSAALLVLQRTARNCESTHCVNAVSFLQAVEAYCKTEFFGGIDAMAIVGALLHHWATAFFDRTAKICREVSHDTGNLSIITIIGLMESFLSKKLYDVHTENLVIFLVSSTLAKICEVFPTGVETLANSLEMLIFIKGRPASIGTTNSCFVEDNWNKRIFFASLFNRTCLLASTAVALCGFHGWINLSIRGFADFEPKVRALSIQTFGILVPLAPLAMKAIQTNKDAGDKQNTSILIEELLTKSKDFSLIDSKLPKDRKIMEIFEESCPQFGNGGKFTIRDYQWKGISWWTTLRRCGLHGILADDMGLGKTLQALLSLVLSRIEKFSSNCQDVHLSSAALIVCPSTLMFHWEAEIKSFFSSCKFIGKVLVCSGGEWKAEYNELIGELCVVIVSYDVLRRNADIFESTYWEMIVLDEAHLIRNPKTVLSKSIFRLKSELRLALTGTPIQNKVEDLWSLMHFLLPDYLGDYHSFSRTFIAPVKKSMTAFRSIRTLMQMNEVAESPLHNFKARAKISAEGVRQMKNLHKLILPFILRRKKEEVLHELPSKTIVDVVCPLSQTQKVMYESFVEKISQRLTEEDIIQYLSNSSTQPLSDINLETSNEETDDTIAIQLYEDITKYSVRSGKANTVLKSNPFQSVSNKSIEPVINHLSVLRSMQLIGVHPALVVDGKLHVQYRQDLIENFGSSGKFKELVKLLIDSEIIDNSLFYDVEKEYSDLNEFYSYLDSDLMVPIDTISDDKNCEVSVTPEMIYRVNPRDFSDSDTEEETQDDDPQHEKDDQICQNSHRISISKKCLIFAKHQSTLDLLEACIFRRFFPNVRYRRLDGNMSAESRFRVAEQFQRGSYNGMEEYSLELLKDALPSFGSSDKVCCNASDIQILLLTTRSSSLGLNLSAADTVIFVENDWNPFIDLQAMNRVHRIGQIHPVTVYRLLADCTIESKVMTIQLFKENIACEVIHGNNEVDTKTIEDIADTNMGCKIWNSLVERSRLDI